MYLTTFPCHLCAKHIVAAGIKRVVYIEPYIKSLTLQLYPEAFSFENENNAEGRVHLLPFVGVAPRAYLSLFPALDRKDDRGKVIPFSPADAVPRLKGHPQTYIRNETRALELLENAVKKASLTTTGTTDVTSENASGPQKYLTSDGSESHGRDRGTEITPEERGGRG
jgi:cytidine deaminase